MIRTAGPPAGSRPWLAGAGLAAMTLVAWLALSCRGEAETAPAAAARWGEPARLRVRVLRTLPHDPTAFTQGLVWHQGSLYESLGQYGVSALRRVDPETGTVLQQVDLPASRFGEGLARIGERLIQLTWRSGEALVWDLTSFEPIGIRIYRGEGWGLCYDGARLVRSDGTDRLTFHDPESFAAVGELAVTRAGEPQTGLNELECVEGWIYANVWGQEEIVRIDPDTGEVGAVIDASGLLSDNERPGTDVLNGIAFHPDSARFYLTGKLWPWLFEVVFVAADEE